MSVFISQSDNMSQTTFSSPSSPQAPDQYALNSNIMVGAIIVLFLVVLFILALHIYAKWFWRRSSTIAARRHASWMRRHRLDFTGEEPFIAGGSLGLDKAAIDALPMFDYRAPPAEESVLECAVCLCEFEENEKCRLLPKCNHTFHTDCIDMWFFSHSTCPLCRTNVTPESLPPAQQEPQTFFPWSFSQSLREAPVMDHRMESTEAITPLPSRDDREALPSLQIEGVLYPTNVLFWGDHNQVCSRLSSPTLGREASTRSLPQLALDIPRRTEDFPNPRCLSLSLPRRAENFASLSLPRCSPTEGEASSSPVAQAPKSSMGHRVSIKRLLSRERRVFPSGQEGGDLDHDASVSPV